MQGEREQARRVGEGPSSRMRATHWTKNFLLSNRRHTHEVTKLTIEQRWVNKSSVKDGIKEKERAKIVWNAKSSPFILFSFLLCILHAVHLLRTHTCLTYLSRSPSLICMLEYHFQKIAQWIFRIYRILSMPYEKARPHTCEWFLVRW